MMSRNTTIVGAALVVAALAVLAVQLLPDRGPLRQTAPGIQGEERTAVAPPGALADPASTRSPGEALGCVFSRDDARAYDLRIRARVSGSVLGVPVRGGPAVPGADGDGLSATLLWRVVGRPGPDVWRFAARVAPEGPLGLQTGLSTEFGFEMSRDCRFVRFGFAEDVDPRARGLVRTLLSSLEVALPSSPATSWETRQTDAFGVYRARYEASGRTLSRTRLGYTRFWSTGSAAGLDLASSRAEADLAADGRWLASLTGAEELRVGLGLTDLSRRETASVETSTRLRLRDEPTGAAALQLPPGLQWELAADAPRAVTAAPRAAPPSADLSRLLADVYAHRRLHGANGVGDAAELLARAFRAHPALPAEVLARLRAGDIPEELRPTLFLGLELAGTPEAHAALVAALEDPSLGEADRARAVAALPDVPSPTEETLEALIGASRFDAERPTDSVPYSATLAIGTLEGRTQESAPALAAAARQALRQRLQEPENVIALGASLLAVGNTGNPDLLGDVAAFLEAEDPYVRGRAVRALRRMPPSATEHLFRALLENTDNPGVRKQIADTFAAQAWNAGAPPSDALVEAAAEALPNESEPDARAALIRLLGAAAGDNDLARSALVAQFGREDMGPLLALIGRYVAAEDLL